MKIRTYDELVNCLVLQEANLPTYKGQIGATAGDLTAVSEELAVLQYLDQYAATTDAKKKTVFEIKQAVFNGDPDDEFRPSRFLQPRRRLLLWSRAVWNALRNATQDLKPSTATRKKSASLWE